MAAAPPVANNLFSLFSHEGGPNQAVRQVDCADVRKWPALWAADSRLRASVGDREIEELIQDAPGRLTYFAATDPAYPDVPLWRGHPDDAGQTQGLLGSGIRDKFWQRCVVEKSGHFPQPGFATVNGDRIEAQNARWSVHVNSLDCRPIRAELLSLSTTDAVVVVEGVRDGFAAVGRDGCVYLKSQNPFLNAHLGGATNHVLSAARWAEFVTALCARPLPLDVTKEVFNPTADLGAALLASPGAYILKPRFGSNGFYVVRVVSHADTRLTVESDCPDTAIYLEEFPSDSDRRGCDLVTAAATHRARFIDRALAGLPERSLNQSLIEEEIRQDRADGAFFEPRIVIQRVKAGAGERFATLGAICKRIETAVGASVARDFQEEPIEASIRLFLRDRVPECDLARRADETRAELLAAGDRLRAAVVPLVEERGARVHQFAIDCRLCWDAPAQRAEFAFLEFQFGIGRIDPGVLPGVQARDELVRQFGPEAG